MNGVLGEGPESFTVVDPNGLVYEYGLSADSRATVSGHVKPYMWLLEKVTDLNGNSIEYEYKSLYGDHPKVSTITYNITSMPVVVSFLYEGRPDSNFHYLAGGKINNDVRLKAVNIEKFMDAGLSNVIPIASYELDYVTDMYSHLKSIKKIGYDYGSTIAFEKLMPTTFEYNEETMRYDISEWGNVDNIALEFVTGDYNGDGKSDMIVFPRRNDVLPNLWFLYLSTGTSFELTQTGLMPPRQSTILIIRKYQTKIIEHLLLTLMAMEKKTLFTEAISRLFRVLKSKRINTIYYYQR